jgi:DNA primase
MIEKKHVVLGILESVLGKGKPSKNGDVDFYCPICNHKKPKLIVNINSGNFNCWTCHPPTKGGNPAKLLKLIGAQKEKILEISKFFGKQKANIVEEEFEPVTLPQEFIPLAEPTSSLELRHALAYLNRRGVTQSDIIKYGIGYCDSGRYRGKVIIPSYNSDNRVNYFVARSISDSAIRKFDAPKCKKSDVIGFENTINWDVPIILCEGPFDGIAVKRNAIPLFGKTIPSAVMKRLVESRVKTVYLALDRDALRESIDSAEKLIKMGKDVYLLDLEEKDPSDIGFKKITELLHSAKQLTYEDLFKIKMRAVFK